MELPVVGAVPGVAELAAGSPEVEPRPLGTPVCAFAPPAISRSPAVTAIVASFMILPLGTTIPEKMSRSIKPRWI
jgi:hypothetical protein